MDLRTFGEFYFKAFFFIAILSCSALLITCSILLGWAVQCNGVEIEGKTLESVENMSKEWLCIVYHASQEPITAYALGVGLSGFVVVFSFLLAFAPCVFARLKCSACVSPPRPFVESMSQEESHKNLERMFSRSKNTITVQVWDDAPFDVYESNGRRFWRPERITKTCTISDLDVRSVSVAEVNADEVVTDECLTFFRLTPFLPKDVVVRVEVQCDAHFRTLVVVPRQGWTPSQMREALCDVLMVKP